MNERFETFTLQIAKISRAIRRIKSFEMEDFDLKSPHVSCLYYLYRNGSPLTAKELCNKCDEDKAAISRSMELLESSQLITFEQKTGKRYNSPISLTQKGKKIGQEIAHRIDEIVHIASSGINDEDRQIFYDCLLKISKNLNNYCKIKEAKGERDEK